MDIHNRVRLQDHCLWFHSTWQELIPPETLEHTRLFHRYYVCNAPSHRRIKVDEVNQNFKNAKSFETAEDYCEEPRNDCHY